MSRKRPTWSISDHVDSQSKYMKRSVSAKQARAIAAKMNKRFPYKDYGRMYVKRNQLGSQSMLAFGPSYRTADAQQRANRKQYGYYGNGLYTGRGRYNFLRSVGRGFKTLGRALKPVASEALKVGINAGAAALLGGGLYTGRGSYGSVATNANTLVDGGDPAMAYEAPNDETEAVVITHREFIGDVYGPDHPRFNSQSYQLNPGLADQFPWLSQIAVNYEEYEWLQLVFEYRSTIDASTVSNGQTGTVIMATQYNLDSVPFTSKDEMMQYHGAMSGRLTEHMVHGIECDPSKNKGSPIRLVRNRPIDPNTQDLDEYDHARFEFAINNCPSNFANEAVGELWVYYKCRLLKPKLGSNRGASTQFALFGNTVASPHTDPYGINSGTIASSLNSLNVTLSQPHSNSTKITFPANLSGLMRIILKVEAAGGGLTGNIIETMESEGNLSYVANQYASSTGSGDTPANRTQLNTTFNSLAIIDVFLRTATAGTNNTITFLNDFGGSGNLVTQSAIEIYELPVVARKAPHDWRPVWFNSNGTRTEL